MGLLDSVGRGISAAATAGGELFGREALEQQKAELQGERDKRLLELKQTFEDKSRAQMVGRIDAGAKGLINARMADHQVADPSIWTPEMEAARNQGLQAMENDQRTRAQAAANAGYIDEAAKLDKIADSGAANVPWGTTRVDADGKVIYDNASVLKGDVERQRTEVASVRAASAARSKADEAKAWQTASKVDKAIVSLPNALGDKEIESSDLREVHIASFNAAKRSGTMDPTEAAEHAISTVNRIKEAARQRLEEARAEDKKSPLTLQQIVRDIINEAKDAARIANAPAVNADAPGAADARQEVTMRERASEAAAASASRQARGLINSEPSSARFTPSQIPGAAARQAEDAVADTKTAEQEAKAAADPDLIRLWGQRKEAQRNNPRAVNRIGQQIADLRKQRYGL